ncbi:hypothetical protein BZA05DRAFT_471622 [Tricharina praecox]|uniref:uncharacterized protein n=1 Tax=Tricharina praecox TaxID=43433 RepID=UPI00221F0232|nr:uncharacterized protein BZA05DRAFT_471622 [Tricharina praecox]KAI5856596.1 hypothetical protein BZA05DRAFT_471622 [Tricharina praecox]
MHQAVSTGEPSKKKRKSIAAAGSDNKPKKTKTANDDNNAPATPRPSNATAGLSNATAGPSKWLPDRILRLPDRVLRLPDRVLRLPDRDKSEKNNEATCGVEDGHTLEQGDAMDTSKDDDEDEEPSAPRCPHSHDCCFICGHNLTLGNKERNQDGGRSDKT